MGGKGDTVSNATGAPPPLQAVISLTSVQDKNKTFLPVDAILYNKEPQPKKEEVDKGKKKRNVAELALLNLPGIKGYGASGKHVAAIMNEKFSKNM